MFLGHLHRTPFLQYSGYDGQMKFPVWVKILPRPVWRAIWLLLIVTALGCSSGIENIESQSVSIERDLEFRFERASADLSEISTDQSAWRSFSDLNLRPLRADQEVWLRARLPGPSREETNLYLHGSFPTLVIYLDGNPLYQFGNPTGGIEEAKMGFFWHLVPLPLDSPGKWLYFRLRTFGYSFDLDDVRLGPPGAYREVLSRQVSQPLRQDFPTVLLGVVIAFVGLAVVVISISFGKGVDLAAVSLGLFCTLYGIRLLAEIHTVQLLFDVPLTVWIYVKDFITYAIEIPAILFAEQILGKGWKSSIRWVLLIQVVYAAVAILLDGVLGVPGAAMAPNSYLAVLVILVIGANVFRPGLALARHDRWVLRAGYTVFALTAVVANLGLLTLSGESVGFFVFLCCLGDVVVRRTRRNEQQLVSIQQELETARRIQTTILPDKMPEVMGLDLAVRYVPMSEVAGDFYDFLVVDEERAGMLVADVSGHGIPAALIASMVKVAFSAQAERAESPSQVLTEMNRIFCGKMKSQFVTAGYIYVDIAAGKLSYSTAGHPPLLLWRHSEEKVHEIKLSGMLMGHLPTAEYVTAEVAIESGDRVILYTDGIVEATNRAGDFFGKERLLPFIESNQELSAANFADALLEHVCDWTHRKLGDGGFEDDLTLLVVNVGEYSKKSRKET